MGEKMKSINRATETFMSNVVLFCPLFSKTEIGINLWGKK